MITKPTVFVLGAGASMPYGFPSGKQLVEHICEATYHRLTFLPSFPDDARYLISRENIQKALNDRFGKKKIEGFGKALFLSQQYSIDSFLEHRTEFIDIGKYAISLFILRKEMEPDIFSFEVRDKGCYQYLFNKLNAGWDNFSQNNVSFITFNYDRSLEHSFFTSLQNTYKKTDDECAEKIQSIPIIHVHGSLGKLRWQDPNGVPYGTREKGITLKRFMFDTEMAFRASEQIKIITENQAVSDEFHHATQLIEKAEYIYFLGFGYHPTNMERLKIRDVLAQKTISFSYHNGKIVNSPLQGTGIGMHDAEMYSVQEKWKVGIPDNVSDSLLFLRKYAKLD